ncbi:MAG TPA: hypothetical protein VN087_00045 [Verrucomicrobiae bacterium]|jgi:hypothetical protein|nr:hypothetical protein [Verrucomicrobiae bacterium]
MLNFTRMRFFPLLCAAFLFTSPANAQTPPPAPSLAPVPPALLNAKTAFISNAGADSGLFPHPFSGDPDRPYNQFYTAMQSWGRYQLVTDPSEADIVFELQLIAPPGPTSGNKVNGASDPVPMFRLVIYDRKTHYVLWALTESITIAFLQKTHDNNFDQALLTIMLDLKRVTGAPVTAASNH